MRLVHEPIQAASPIEQRILGVQVQVNEIGMRHIYQGYRPPCRGSKQEMFTNVHQRTFMSGAARVTRPFVWDASGAMVSTSKLANHSELVDNGLRTMKGQQADS
jgi:hypothetical protein